MTNTNISPDATIEPARPVNFDPCEGAPDIEDVIYGLHGVCNALHRENFGGNMDFEKINRIANLAWADNVLSEQLWSCQTGRPSTKRKLKAV